MFGQYFRLELSSKSDFIAFAFWWRGRKLLDIGIVFNMHLLVHCEYIISPYVIVSLVIVYVG